MAVKRRQGGPCQRNITMRNRFAALEVDVGEGLAEDSPKDSTITCDMVDAETHQQVATEPELITPRSQEAVSCDGVSTSASPKCLVQSSEAEIVALDSTFKPAHPSDQTNTGTSAKDPSEGSPAALELAAAYDTQACEVVGQLSKAAKKRAQKKARKNICTQAAGETSKADGDGPERDLSEDVGSSMCTAEAPDCQSDSPTSPQLTQEQARALAELAVKLNEQHIANHLRAVSCRRILLATPVDPLLMSGHDLLAVEPGDVIHCEVTDALGWGFGSIVAPLRLAGKRGCFSCESMRPIIAEVRTNRSGDTLEFTPGSWAEVAASQDRSTKNRLREKAALNRLRAARDACEKLVPR